MIIKKLYLTPYILLTSTLMLLSSTSFAGKCNDLVPTLTYCGASTNFIYTYEKICDSGSELNYHDIKEILWQHQEEISHNECLAKYYKEPQADREKMKEQHKTRQELKEYLKEQYD